MPMRRASSRKWRYGIVAVLVLAAAGVVLPEFVHMPGQGTQPTGQQGGGGRRRGGQNGPQQPVAVMATAVRANDVPVTIDGVGTARPAATVVVRPQVDGQLIEVRFREGTD